MPRWAGNRQSPIDDQIAEADIADRLRMANALRDKSMAGAQLENVGGHLIGNPYARALTGVVQGFEGGQERKKAYGMAEDLAASKRDRLAKALAGAGQEETPEGRLKRGTELMGNPDPQAQEVGRYMAESAQKEIARREEAQQKQYAETNKDLRDMKTLLGNQDLAAQKAKNDRELAEWKFNHPPPSTAQPPMPAASLQEIEYLRSLDNLPPDQREAKRNEFFQVKRAQQVIDRGGSQDVLQPGAEPGAVAASLPKTVPPARTAEHLAEVEREKKRVTLAPKAQAALSQFEAKTQQFNDAIDRAIEKTSGWSAGAMGWSSGIPLTPAKELAAELQEIASNIGFDALAEMRANSPTGAALGNVANYEIQNLQSTLGTLDQAREPEKIVETLTRIKHLRQASLERMKDAYNETWGAAPMAPQPPPPAAAAPSPPPPADYSHLSNEQLMQQLMGGQP